MFDGQRESMDRLRNALGNFVTGFLTAFVVVSFVRDRKTGVRAGLLWGLVSAVATWVIAGKLSPSGDFDGPSAEDHTFDGTETAD